MPVLNLRIEIDVPDSTLENAASPAFYSELLLARAADGGWDWRSRHLTSHWEGAEGSHRGDQIPEGFTAEEYEGLFA